VVSRPDQRLRKKKPRLVRGFFVGIKKQPIRLLFKRGLTRALIFRSSTGFLTPTIAT
jgi:hypothetical protein